MRYRGLRKVGGGRFITRYDISYETSEGKIKEYEAISRNPNLKDISDLRDSGAEAVVIIAHDVTGEKILINKEFRMAVGDYAYNFPAGLIDPGEDIEQAARRELWEETGLTLTSVIEKWPESYSAVGVMNEKAVVLICTAEGEFAPSTSAEEEIEAMWFTKEQMRDLIRENKSFASRTQCYCALWSRNN